MGKYFTIEELSKSSTAEKMNIDNTPPDKIVKNLNNLIDYILDPLREKYGKPIIVSSGYRCKKLNSAIGGAKNSQHCLGFAADIKTVADTRLENKKLFDLIQSLKLPFDQLINEHNFDWIHVSYSDRHRRQILNIW